MLEVKYDRGIFLPGPGLWMDSQRRRDRAFISHAHSDHTARHQETILTAITERLMRARMGNLKGACHCMNYGETREFEKFRITLLPAGHVLGSAQAYLECGEGTLLYTGDFKLRSGSSSETAQTRHAETLIMETTYGLPRYVFPPTEQVVAEIVDFCAETLESGGTPVLLGYALGKAQEILAALREEDFKIMLHESIAKLTPIYEAGGIPLPPYRKFSAELASGHILIMPPSAMGSRTRLSLRRPRVAMLSGWGLDASAIYRYRCDKIFPLSDHADYPGLLRMVELVNPKRVLTHHGFAQEFARDLRARGIEAWALTGANQLDLSFS